MFKKTRTVKRTPFIMLKGQRLCVGDYVKVNHILHMGIHRVALVIDPSKGYKYIALAIHNNAGEDIWLTKEVCTKWEGEIPTISNPDPEKKLALTDKVEIFDGVNWKGPYQLTAIYLNRTGINKEIVYKSIKDSPPNERHHAKGNTFRKYTGNPNDTYI